jgi:hypothetical protein
LSDRANRSRTSTGESGVSLLAARTLGVRGIGARPLWLAIVASMAMFSLFTATAQALETRPYTGVSFGPEGVSGGATFTDVGSITVDQSTGMVYVLDEGEHSTPTSRLYKFTAAGEPSDFASLGTNVIEGISLAEPGENQVAVAPPGAPGGTAGDIYIARYPNVQTYSPGGLILAGGSFGIPEACGVATDPAGNVYIGAYPSEIAKYEPSTNPPSETDLKGTSTAELPEICNVGVGGAGEVYAANYAGQSGIVKLEGLEAPAATQIDPTARTLAVDAETGDLFADFESGFRQYDSTGALTLTAGTNRLSGSRGIAVNDDADTVYVGNEADHLVDIFGAAEVKVPGPKFVSSEVISVNSSEATLGAVINPNGEATTFQVEYGPTTAYDSITPPRPVGDDEAPDRVTEILTGLTVGATYHWRIVATSSITVDGPDGTFTTLSPPSTGAVCPNELFRTGLSANLPDCRAYELVTPIDKGGLNIEPSDTLALNPNELYQAAADGGSMTFSSSQAIGESEGASYAPQYLSNRSETAGWETHPIAARQSFSFVDSPLRVILEYLDFTPDLCHGVLQNFAATPIAPGAAEGYGNLYGRELCAPGEQVTGLTPQRTELPESEQSQGLAPNLEGMSADGRCVVYSPPAPLERARLAAGAEREGLRENCAGVERQINFPPEGAGPTEFATAGSALDGLSGDDVNRFGSLTNALSEDGRVVYWTGAESSNTGAGHLWVRINAPEPQSALGPGGECTELSKACTLPVSELVGDGRQGVIFDGASTDGTRAYFSVDGSAGPGSGKLYEYNLIDHSARLVAEGITPIQGSLNGNPITPLVGLSQDGHRAYLVSSAALGSGAVAGDQNLYFYDADASPSTALRFVADLGPSGSLLEPARATPDGGTLIFQSSAQLTGYVNREAGSGEPVTEVYEYAALADGGTGRLTCLSCNPTGAAPRGVRPTIKRMPASYVVSGAIPFPQTAFHGAGVVTADASQVFFESYEALVPSDTNGKNDVYEWSAAGTHGCLAGSSTFSSAADGCLSLISSGEGGGNSYLLDNTSDGTNVFFSTGQSLLPQDPGLVDIYDARVNGGFAPAAGPPAACEGEACQGPLSPPADVTPASSAYVGPGNIRPKKKHHKKHHKKQHNANGGGKSK